MKRDVELYLWDIREGCRLIAQFTADRSFEEYQQDAMLRSAVERQFEIIGEATNQMLKLAPEMRQHISDCRPIVAFRNQLIHGYRVISDREVWQIVQDDLPRLQEIDALLASMDPSQEKDTP